MRAAVILVVALIGGAAPIACKGRTPRAASRVAPILLFDGTGTSPNDVAAVEAVLEANHLDYATADSSQLNAMSDADLRAYRLLIVPGGNFIDISDNLKSTATTNVRNAVKSGTSYLGICAGAFLAGQPVANAFNLTDGVRFRFYADEKRGIRKAAVAIAAVGAPTLDQYWEDGPELTGWGAVVAKYPDGTPAVVEGTSGSGWVILSGVHPEAPASWRRGLSFTTPASADNAYAATLIVAALNRTSLPHD